MNKGLRLYCEILVMFGERKYVQRDLISMPLVRNNVRNLNQDRLCSSIDN